MTTTNPKDSRPKDRAVNAISSGGSRPNYEVRVGVFTIIAVILLLYGWTWLKSFSLFHPPQLITVQFHDIAGLASNAPVNINGVRVGTVEQIDLKGKGQVYCRLRIKTEEVIVPQGSTFTIQTLGLVGAKYVEISLPEESPGQQPPPPIDTNTVVIGQDPVRVELVMNKIATNLNGMITRLSDEGTQSSFADALKHSGEAVRNINEAATKLNKNMDKVEVAADSFTTTSQKIGKVADNASTVTSSANRFFNTGTGTLGDVSSLTKDLRQTSGKVNKMLDNPDITKDLKETVNLARQTAETISRTIKDMNTTLTDKPLRQDLLTALENVNKSTSNIYESLKVLNTIKDDKELRGDIKEVVRDAKAAMSRLDNIMGEPGFKDDLRSTVKKVNAAATNVDLASRQIHQVLNQRAPLLRMIFSNPGRLKEEQEKAEKKLKEEEKKIDKESKNSEVAPKPNHTEGEPLELR